MFSCKEQVKETAHVPYLPLLRASNQLIAFDSLTVENVKSTGENLLLQADKTLKEILSVKRRDYQNTLKALDHLYNSLNRVKWPLELMSAVHPDSALRLQIEKTLISVNNYLFGLNLNEALYNALKDFSSSGEAQRLPASRRLFLDKTLLKYKRSGFDLQPAQREEVKKLRLHIDRLSMNFSNNIASASAKLTISPKDTTGLRRDFLAPRKNATGNYDIDLSKPSYIEFMKYCPSDSLRKQLFRLYNNRAVPENLPIIDSLLHYRQKMAVLLGYKSYAEYTIEEKMAKKPQVVWSFENSLIDMLHEKAKIDYDLLLKAKSTYLKKKATTIEEWEQTFYLEKISQTDYKIDQREVSQYFELNNVIQGLFQITQRLFGLKYEEISNPQVWHKEVRMFNCYDSESNKLLGRFYLDLFPRAKKYTHAAMFTITPGMLIEPGNKEIPEAALVCNFPKPEGDKPALLFSYDVETFFHEFGHLIHGLVAGAELSSQSGPESTPQDFAEAPSQIYENWAYQKATLTLFAKHYQTGQIIPDELITKMIAIKTLNSGLDALRQLFYATLDMTLHDKYTPYTSETTTDVIKKLKKKITWFDVPDDTYLLASFGHFVTYPAGYYGYMWSKVYAQDMWSIFEDKGMLNSDLGRQYRQKVLEPGGSKDPMDLVKNFLGREPNTKALLRDLGLTFKM